MTAGVALIGGKPGHGANGGGFSGAGKDGEELPANASGVPALALLGSASSCSSSDACQTGISADLAVCLAPVAAQRSAGPVYRAFQSIRTPLLRKKRAPLDWLASSGACASGMVERSHDDSLGSTDCSSATVVDLSTDIGSLAGGAIDGATSITGSIAVSMLSKALSGSVVDSGSDVASASSRNGGGWMGWRSGNDAGSRESDMSADAGRLNASRKNGGSSTRGLVFAGCVE